VASEGAITLVATKVQMKAVVGNSVVSGGATSATVRVPLDTVHTFNAVNKDAVHNRAMSPPLHATLAEVVGDTLIDTSGALDNDADLDSVLGAMGDDLVSVTLNNAGIKKDTVKTLSLRRSSTCGSMTLDAISPASGCATG
jgi:hypothetical protein